jgi:uncharacterized protein YdaU (DUF1376 family)
MAKKLPYFKWYPGDAETDENFKSMDDAEIGFYMRCLNHAWLNGGLPADPGDRARALRSPRKYCDSQWGRVGRCFELDMEDGERLVNRRQEEERSKAETKSQRATNSVRTRYERSQNVSPRALARSESVSVSSPEVEVNKKKDAPIPETDFDLEARFQAYRKRHPGSQTRLGDCRAAYTNILVSNTIGPCQIADLMERIQEKWLQYWSLSKTMPLGLLNFLLGGDCMIDPPHVAIDEDQAWINAGSTEPVAKGARR